MASLLWFLSVASLGSLLLENLELRGFSFWAMILFCFVTLDELSFLHNEVNKGWAMII